MKLSLTRISSIKDIKEEFSKEFPFLKIEFFKSLQEGKRSSGVEFFHGKTILSEVNPKFKDMELVYASFDSVAHLEQRFQNAGLPVQVFRKAGKSWLQTIQTDHLSLEVQNKMGKATSTSSRFNSYTLFL